MRVAEMFILLVLYFLLQLVYFRVLLSFLKFQTLFASSTLNLCELIGLRPDLARLRKILYFHENQLVYPVRKQKDRDFQYGYNQILSWYVYMYLHQFLGLSSVL